MITDILGNPLGKGPEYLLSVWQKRQAAMLYHWMSLDYLRGLKDLIDALIKGADVTVELARRQGRDALIANPRWGVRDTSANWSTYAFPALEDFRKSTIWHIAARVNENFGKTGATQCGRMLSEFSSMWMTEEEEERFNKQWETVFSYASKIDDAAGAGGEKRLDDFGMVLRWQEDEALNFPRLPKFRVRTDVEALSGKRPPRTGVYVPQDDPNGTLQFGWTGNDDGKLGKVQTFNDKGLHALHAIGRNALWLDESKMVAYVAKAFRQGLIEPVGGRGANEVTNITRARIALFDQTFTERPCKWYFVEMIDGEFDDAAEDESNTAPERARSNIPANQACSEAGWWFTPAQAHSRRYFKQGEILPSVGGDYGQTFWQWSPDQSAPKL